MPRLGRCGQNFNKNPLYFVFGGSFGPIWAIAGRTERYSAAACPAVKGE